MEVHLTPTIGTCIAQVDLQSEGTFGFYVKFPEHGNKVFAVRCRHVLFPDSECANLYQHNNTSQLRRLVLLPGNRYLGMMRERAANGARDQQFIIDRYNRDLSALAGQEGRDTERSQKRAQFMIDEVMETMNSFQQLVKDLNTQCKDSGKPDYRAYSILPTSQHRQEAQRLYHGLGPIPGLPVKNQEFRWKRSRTRTRRI